MTKQRLTVLIIIGVLSVVAGLQIFSRFSARPVDPAAARAKGDPQAKVRIVEFIDFQCPACANGSKILKEYSAKHPSDLHVQVKYFPLASHPHSMQAALYSECAGRQKKFWEFHDLLMVQQPQWSPLLSADGSFQNIAREAGLDLAQVNACIASEDAMKAVTDDQAQGKSMGVKSTPTYFINNTMAVGTQTLTEQLNTFFPPDK